MPGCGSIPYGKLLERIATERGNFQGWPFPVAAETELGVSGCGSTPQRNLLERIGKRVNVQGWPFSGGRRAGIGAPGLGWIPRRNLVEKVAKESRRSHGESFSWSFPLDNKLWGVLGGPVGSFL